MASIRPTSPAASRLAAAAAAEERLSGLPPDARAELLRADAQLARGDLDGAERALRALLAAHSEHTEVLRLYAVVARLRGRIPEALAAVRHALKRKPDDALLLNAYGAIVREAGDVDAAIAAYRRACELKPDLASAWHNLGIALQTQGDVTQAEAAYARAVACEPNDAGARVAHGNALKSLGRIDEAVAAFRAALAVEPRAAHAWAGLAEIKTVPLGEGDLAALDRARADARLGEEQRAIVGFARAKALEDLGRLPEAFDAFVEANGLMRRLSPWDAAAHSRGIDRVMAAFDAPPAPAPDAALGREVVFVVSLPRAGSTLAEQILASHPEVEGAGELNDLALIVHGESERRGKPYPEWIGEATPEDWQRLGRLYLERTRRWRASRPIHVDKSLLNWPLLGAAAAMLPGARFVHARRDALETCWSCYRQRFVRGQQAFSYAFDDLAAYWIDYDRLMFFWHARHPGRIYELAYERLVGDPEPEIRRLLDFLGLPFAASCLRFHESKRAVRTASAAQVREPMRKDTARAPGYGALLDPLRRALGT